MKPNTDADFLFLSTRVRAMERSLLTKERMEQMLEAPTVEDAAKVLAECGYPEVTKGSVGEFERILSEQRNARMDDLGRYAITRSITDIFRLRYDYHNAKTLVKAEALGIGQTQILMHGGRYAPQRLAEDYRRKDFLAYSDPFRRAVSRAREILGSTGDPQQADFVLDRAYFEEMSALAKASGNRFLNDYAALCIDAANLRAVVRTLRLSKGAPAPEQALVPGGTVSVRALCGARGDELNGLFHTTRLAAAAAEGSAKASPGSGPLTEFERLCDDAITNFLRDERRVPFGLEPILGYLHARETEAVNIRIIMTGRIAGLDTDIIRERLRESYV